jgi:two-component system, sensor histidine kinase PdtaS
MKIQSLNQQKVLHDTILARKTEEAKRKEIEVFSLSAGLFLFILFSVYVWYNYRKSRKGEELLESSLKEKEVLLKEVHHRVKNNFQVISSLLNLQANTITDEKTQKALLDAQNRIRSMSLVHQKLYQTNNFSEIQIGDYIKQLASSIENSYKKKDTDIELEIDTGNLSFSLEIVIPLGLIVNELLTNSYKYAFDEKAKGKIRVKLFKTDENKYNLVVKDNGKGFPPGFELEKQESLGLTLVSLLAEQIGGEVKAENHAGCSFTISFKENLA